MQREDNEGHGEPSPEQARRLVFMESENQVQAWEHNARQLGLWWEQGRLRGPDGPISPTVVHPSYGPLPSSSSAGVPAAAAAGPPIQGPPGTVGSRYTLGGSSPSTGTWRQRSPDTRLWWSPEAPEVIVDTGASSSHMDQRRVSAPASPAPGPVRSPAGVTHVTRSPNGIFVAGAPGPGTPPASASAAAAPPRSASPQPRLRQRRVETLVPDPNQRVVVTRHGSCYHAPFCGYLANSVLDEVTLHDAQQVRNLRPCGSCDVDSFVRQQMVRNPHE